MAIPNDSPGADQDELQFEQAEFPAETSAIQEHVTRCSACTAAIPDVYFEAGGKIVCAPCRDKIEAMIHHGSGLGRGFKAIVFGTIAAALGAVLYYAIIRITGLNIGLVAVVVGLMVGGAVKAGSGNRGGRFYQLLAVFLTYSAIAAMQFSLLFEASRKSLDQQAPAVVAAPDGKPAPAALKQAKLEAGKKDQAPALQPAVQPPRAQREQPSLGRFLLAATMFMALLIRFAYSLPVLHAFHAPISGLIFGFALWEAWRINRRVRLAFNGPFRLGTLPGDEPANQPEEADDEP